MRAGQSAGPLSFSRIVLHQCDKEAHHTPYPGATKAMYSIANGPIAPVLRNDPWKIAHIHTSSEDKEYPFSSFKV